MVKWNLTQGVLLLSLSVPTASGVTCTDLTYKCKNNKCISKVNPECDGTEDCDDGSDEENCGMLRTTISLFAWSQIWGVNYNLHLHCSPCNTKANVCEPLPNSESVTSCNKLQPFVWLIDCVLFQTVGGVCSSHHVLWAVRMQKKGSSPGRSASTSKTTVTCAEHPSSVHAGWSLLPTVCKTTPRRSRILFFMLHVLFFSIDVFVIHPVYRCLVNISRCWTDALMQRCSKWVQQHSSLLPMYLHAAHVTFEVNS